MSDPARAARRARTLALAVAVVSIVSIAVGCRTARTTSGADGSRAERERAGPRLHGGALPGDVPAGLVDSVQDLDLKPDVGGTQPGDLVVAPVPFFSQQVGFGLGLGTAYVFRFDPESAPSTLGAGAFYTDNGSKGAFGAFTPAFGGDDWRLTLMGGLAEIRYDFYGIGQDAGDDGDSVALESEADFVRLEALRALRRSWYLGPRVTAGTVRTEIEGSGTLNDLLADQLDVRSVLLGLHLLIDLRDDTFYPRDGSQTDVSGDVASSAFGSDLDFFRGKASHASYHALGDEDVLAWQAIVEYAGDDAPFFALPSHALRGYESGRYRDQLWTAAQVELRHRLNRRFGAVLFGGLGAVGADVSDLLDSELLPSVGVGLRIRLSDENPIDYRIDVAAGADGEVILSMSVGQAF
jgi:hypothetical protein